MFINKVDIANYRGIENLHMNFSDCKHSNVGKGLMELGWKGLFDAERGLEHTVEILREMMG